MASNGNDRGGLLKAGGVLSIMGGALEVIGGEILVGLAIAGREVLRPGAPSSSPGVNPGWEALGVIAMIVVGVPIFALGIVAILGGVSAIRRKRFRLSLAGAICTLPSVFLGIAAVILVALGKSEFGTKD
jgi:hypothetical protein